MKEFICIECNHVYNEQDVPKDFVCKRKECPGDGLTGLCINYSKNPSTQSDKNETAPKAALTIKECGLCVLLMDASGSMFQDPAFKDVHIPSQYGMKFCSKAELVSKAAAQAIFELRQMTKTDAAYVCVIRFDHQQSMILNDTVENILSTHQSTANLAKHFYDQLGEMRGGTNLNAALKMGHSYIDKFIEGKVPGMEKYAPLYHTQYIAEKGDWIEIPNVRVMVYTDGEQSDSYGKIVNPFKGKDIDLLLGAYVGDPKDQGCKDLQSVIGTCPIHGEQQFTILDAPEKIATLRGFFRMASGTSGFCQKCLDNETKVLR